MCPIARKWLQASERKLGRVNSIKQAAELPDTNLAGLLLARTREVLQSARLIQSELLELQIMCGRLFCQKFLIIFLFRATNSSELDRSV